MYRLCYRFVGNHEDAADLTQDVFLRAYRALPTFKGESALGTWLYRIAVNVSLNRVGGADAAREHDRGARSLPRRRSDAGRARCCEAERAARVRRGDRAAAADSSARR